jgi:hypothetical protein
MASAVASAKLDDGVIVHRIGGGSIQNLRLKSREKTIARPGISVLAEPTSGDAARAIRSAFPRATRLHAEAGTVGSATVGQIRAAGFDVVSSPSINLPSHCRIVHPNGVGGFDDANLAVLERAFANTAGN